jgi:alkylhydroperoxidase family enzyme
VLDEHASAPVDDKLRQTLYLLEKMTRQPEQLSPEDVRRAMRAGASKAAIQDAIEVAFLFNIYDRLADAMAWDVPAVESGYYRAAAARLLTRGYE